MFKVEGTYQPLINNAEVEPFSRDLAHEVVDIFLPTDHPGDTASIQRNKAAAFQANEWEFSRFLRFWE